MKKTLKLLILLVMLTALAVAIFQVGHYFLITSKAENDFKVLSKQVANDEDRLVALKALAVKNPDMIGWVKIDGTTIDYPVMHTPSKPQHYLRMDFNGNYSKFGTPFLDGNCNWRKPVSTNLILYGHNIKAGIMFSPLTDYKDWAFYEEHQYIEFDTLERLGKYQIFVVIKSTTTNASELYNFIDCTDKQEFNEAIARIQKMSMYGTKITPSFGDEMLTLSTCEYSNQNGRFIVVAKRVK